MDAPGSLPVGVESDIALGEWLEVKGSETERGVWKRRMTEGIKPAASAPVDSGREVRPREISE